MSDLDSELGLRLKDFIKRICEDIGPRLGTSEEERNAGMRIEEAYKQYCGVTLQEEFSCHPAAFLDVVRVSVVIYMIGLLFYIAIPGLTAILGAITLILFVAEMMSLKEVIDPLFPKKTGFNVYGKIPAKRTAKQIVLVSGHHDSAYEFPLQEQLGSRFSAFIRLTVGLGLVTVILSIVRLLVLLILPSILSILDLLTIIPITSAIPMLVFAFRLRSNNIVLGANDNLSAVAVTLGVGEWLKTNPLQHTEVWLVSFACEENMRGSKRFAEAHKEELREAFLLNFDGVGAGSLYVLTAEPMYLTTLTSELCELVLDAANEEGLDIASGVPSFGGTDASNFIKAGLRATAIVGISESGFLENWHTLADTPENIDESVLVDAVKLAIAVLKKIDTN